MNTSTAVAPPAATRMALPLRISRGSRPAADDRLLVLDVLRAIAALSVVLHHLPPLTGPLIVLRPLQAIGFIGVGLFLVLSGFAIHYRWAATRHDGEFDQRKFWARRFFRLVPSYWVAALIAIPATLIAGLLLQPVAPWGGGEEFVPWWLAWFSQITAVPANVVPVPVLWVTWTIALEVQLYAAYALIVLFTRRFDPVRILIVCAAVTFAWRIGAQWFVSSVPAGGFLPDGSSPLESRFFYSQMPARAFEWFLGMLAAEAWFGNVRLPRWAANGLLAVAGLLVVGGIQRNPLGEMTLNGNTFMFTDVLFDPLVGITFFALLNFVLAHQKSRWMNVANGRPLRAMAYVGLFSYSIYLVHLSVILVWNEQFGTTSMPLVVAEFAVAVAASWAFFMLIERHFLGRSSWRRQGEEA